MNPHGHHWPLDFKSSVSTNSTIRAKITALRIKFQKKIPCGILDLSKVLSEKRDSNPRPRPWQGRALPTELFSLIGKANLMEILYLFQSRDLFYFIQFIQCFQRCQVIYIQVLYLITNLLKNRVIQLDKAHLEPFPLGCKISNGFGQ